jgi:hypothetical protein
VLGESFSILTPAELAAFDELLAKVLAPDHAAS